MKRSAALLVLIFIVCSISGVSQSNTPDPSKAILDRLDSITRQPESEWRFHSDIPHPEDPSVTVGPVIDGAAHKRILEYIDIGKQEARLAFQRADVPGPGGGVPGGAALPPPAA